MTEIKKCPLTGPVGQWWMAGNGPVICAGTTSGVAAGLPLPFSSVTELAGSRMTTSYRARFGTPPLLGALFQKWGFCSKSPNETAKEAVSGCPRKPMTRDWEGSAKLSCYKSRGELDPA